MGKSKFSAKQYGKDGLDRLLEKLQGEFDKGQSPVCINDWANQKSPRLVPPHIRDNDSLDEALEGWAARHPGAIEVRREWDGDQETFEVTPLTTGKIKDVPEVPGQASGKHLLRRQPLRQFAGEG